MIVFRTANERFRWKRTLLAGHPGDGLSRAAASWPNPLYVRFVPGLVELADRDLPFTLVQSVDDLLGVLAAVVGSGPQFLAAGATAEPSDLAVETLVIDTVGELEQLLGADAAKMNALMVAISALPLHVVLLCRLTHKDGRQFPLSCLNGAILNYVDVALCVEDGHLQARPDDRLPWVLDRSGLLPRTVTLTFTDDYERLAAALGQDLGAPAPEADSAPPSPPPPPPPSVAAAPATAPSPPPPPPLTTAENDYGDDEDEGGVELPMCTSQGRLGNQCLGRVESEAARDVSVIRWRNRPMCGPCNDAEFAAMPKKFPVSRTTRPAGSEPAGSEPVPGHPPGAEKAVVPHGEPVGQVSTTSDPDLLAFLRS